MQQPQATKPGQKKCPFDTIPQSVNCRTATFEQLVWAWNNNIPIEGITIIASHPFWHPDEIFGYFLTKETAQGRKRFIGIENSIPAVVTQTKLLKMKWTGFSGFIRAMMEQGVLLIGVGRGPLDEHTDRSAKISCLETIVKLLRLEADKSTRVAIHAIREFIAYEDNNGDNLLKAVVNAYKSSDKRLGVSAEDQFKKLPKEVSDVLLMLQAGMFTGTIKKGWETINPANESEFLNVFNTAYNLIAFNYNQAILFQDAGDEYAKQKEQIKERAVPLNSKGDYRLLIVESDNLLMAKAVWNRNPSDAPVKAGMLLIVKKTGVIDPDYPELVGKQFAIMPSAEYKDVMQDIYQILQQKVHGAQFDGKLLPFQQLGHYGSHRDVPQLYFDENQKIIMNGSRRDFDVPGLVDIELSIDMIIEAIQTVCLKRFEKRHMHTCKQGTCVKTANNTHCSQFCFNLAHCRAVQATTKPAPHTNTKNSKEHKGNGGKGNNQGKQFTGGGNKHHKSTGNNGQHTKQQQPVKHN